MHARRREWLANAMTWILAACALASTALVVRRELVANASTRPRMSIEPDWQRFAFGHVLRDSGAQNSIVVFSDFQPRTVNALSSMSTPCGPLEYRSR